MVFSRHILGNRLLHASFDVVVGGPKKRSSCSNVILFSGTVSDSQLLCGLSLAFVDCYIQLGASRSLFTVVNGVKEAGTWYTYNVPTTKSININDAENCIHLRLAQKPKC